MGMSGNGGESHIRPAVRPLCTWGEADGAENCTRHALERVTLERGGTREERRLCTPHADDVCNSPLTMTVVRREDIGLFDR